MLTSGDVVELDFGIPEGSEAGMVRPAIVVTAQRILSGEARVIQVVPVTGTIRRHAAEVYLASDPSNGLSRDSAAQCQHIRGVAGLRVRRTLGNVGPVALAQVRGALADLLEV